MSNKTGKVIGGFLIGAGVLTYLLHCKDAGKLMDQLTADTKKLASQAGDKFDDLKEETSHWSDQVINFAIDNKKGVIDTVSYLYKMLAKKA